MASNVYDHEAYAAGMAAARQEEHLARENVVERAVLPMLAYLATRGYSLLENPTEFAAIAAACFADGFLDEAVRQWNRGNDSGAHSKRVRNGAT